MQILCFRLIDKLLVNLLLNMSSLLSPLHKFDTNEVRAKKKEEESTIRLKKN